MTINITEENSIFLLIDIQEKLVNMLKEDIKNQCEKNANILVNLSNLLNIETIITEQYPKGLGTTIEKIKNKTNKNTLFLEKTTFDALLTDDIKELFEKTEKKNIFVFGIETHICVFQTVLSLLNKNFNVFVVKDACASRNKEQYKTSINLMEKEGAKIITSEMTLFCFLKSSKHEKFKELQALIK